MRNTGTAYVGKWGEYIVIAELLRRGYDVYAPLVDNQGIDCIIRRGDNDYVDLQIKARSKNCQLQNAGSFNGMKILKPREKYFFILYSERVRTYWIFPSTDLVAEAVENKEGKTKGKFSITLTGQKNKEPYPLPEYTKYENKFDLLRT